MKQKIKIMENKPHPSDEEIRSYMNFDRLLDNRKIALSSSKTLSVLKWSVPALIITVSAVWFFWKNAEPEEVLSEDKIRSDTMLHSHGLSPLAVDTLSIETQTEPVPSSYEIKHAQERKIQKQKGEEQVTIKDSEKPATTSNYVQAEPVSGYADLYNFFSSNLKYPPEGLKDSIQGVQTISFIINTAGKPEQIAVVNSLGESFDREAKRLIEVMPVWKPASLDGKPVASKISIPITFQIQKIKN